MVKTRSVGLLLVLGAVSVAPAQLVTGHWEFDDPANGLRATIGQNGSFFTYIPPSGNAQGVTQFDTTTAFGIPALPGAAGPVRVAYIPGYNGNEAIAMYPGVPANPVDPNVSYINQYTFIFDILIPNGSAAPWVSFFNTNECNRNDGDFFAQQVNPADPLAYSIGISGQYDGVLFGNTWHRVIISVNLADPYGPLMSKYIDGALVGEQILGSGVDGRWSLYPVGDNLPTLILGDNNGDTGPIYVAALQFRNYAVDAATAATLGGVGAAGIPVDSGTQGYWNFRSVSAPLAPAAGFTGPASLTWFNGCAPTTCPFDLRNTTQFGPSTSFGVPALPDGVAHGMRFDAPYDCNGYLLPHGAAPNGGGAKVNQYTIIADVYFTADDINPTSIAHGSVTLPHEPDWVPLYANALPGVDDAMLWMYFPNGTIGDDGQYGDTEGWIQFGTWMRVVCSVDTSADPAVVSKYVIYADDTVRGPVTQLEAGEGLDGRRALVTAAAAGENYLFAFGDGGIYTVPYTRTGFCSSYQVRDYAMPASEVAALGGPRAAGIPRPVPAVCPGDLNCDGQVNFDDIDLFVEALSYSGGAGWPYPACPWIAGDCTADGNVNFDDIDAFVARIGADCP